MADKKKDNGLETVARNKKAYHAFFVLESFEAGIELFGTEEEEIPADITELVEARTAAKKAKDFAEADRIRDELKAKGYIVKDTPNGPQVERI